MILKFTDVDYTYHTLAGETEALKGLNFDILRGQFVSVIGPSGCGKTTILSLAAGILQPTGGEITRGGGDCGYMLQRDALFPWRTVEENIFLPLEIRGTKNAAEKSRAPEPAMPCMPLCPATQSASMPCAFMSTGICPHACAPSHMTSTPSGRAFLTSAGSIDAPVTLEASVKTAAAVSSRAARASYRPRSRVLPPVPRTYSYLYALKSPCEWVPLSESEGRMCAQNAGVSPPCFPVVIAGEIIGGRAIEILGSAEHTFGLSQGRIKVVKMR